MNCETCEGTGLKDQHHKCEVCNGFGKGLVTESTTPEIKGKTESKVKKVLKK